MNQRHPAVALALTLLAATALAQPPVPRTLPIAPDLPAAPAAPAAPIAPVAPVAPVAPSPASRTVPGIRNKLSAGDLPSAESILEVHRERYGEDGTYLMGLGWVARGALLVGEPARARELNGALRRLCDERMARGADLAKDDSLENALGASIEVEAQLRAGSGGAAAAASWVSGQLAKFPGPVAFRARLYKRLNLLALAGSPAPELAIEDFVGTRPSPLSELRGRPVVVFVWAEGCGDCKAQSAALGRVTSKYAAQGLVVVPLTRYYEEAAADRILEKARVDSVWADVYRTTGPASIVISTESMQRYGGSSTPTFVFIDRRGVVRGYTPTRLTEAALESRVRELLR
jgi:thiol-disulfide isomerase/thioredoxin